MIIKVNNKVVYDGPAGSVDVKKSVPVEHNDVRVFGDCGNITTHSSGRVEVWGNVLNGVMSDGSVTANTITGDVQAKGNVSVGYVRGNIKAEVYTGRTPQWPSQ